MLALAAPALGAQELVHSVPISWEAVSGATRYLVEIRPLHGDVLFSRSTSETTLTADLAPGHYQLRVTAFNLFDKPAAATPWNDFEVVRVYAPAYTGIETPGLYAGAALGTITVTGDHFGPDTTVALAREGRTIEAASVGARTATRLEASFALATIAAGTYDLVLGNPDSLVTVVPAALHVAERVQPSLVRLSLSFGYDDRVYRGVTLSGGGLGPATRVELRAGTRTIAPFNLVSSSPADLAFDLDLGGAQPGSYDVVAVNPGGLSATIEQALRVAAISAPVVERITPNRLTIGESDGSFAVAGSSFTPETAVYLVSGDRRVPVLVAPRDGAGDLECRIDPAFAGVGHYDVVVANSAQLVTTLPGAMEILPYPAPKLTSITPNQGVEQQRYAGVVVSGANLAPHQAIYLRRGAVQIELPATWESNTEYRLDLDLTSLAPGSYDLLLGSNNDIVAQLPSAFRVVPRPIGPPPPPPSIVHPQAVRLTAGYPVTLILSNGLSAGLAFSLLGADLDIAFPIGNRFLGEVPILNSLGLEIGGTYASFSATGSAQAADLSLTSGTTALYYRTPFNFPLNGIVRAGWGMALTSFSNTISSATFGSTALDYLVELGASAEIDLGKTFFVEPGFEWQRIYYGASSIDIGALFVRAGVRLGQ